MKRGIGLMTQAEHILALAELDDLVAVESGLSDWAVEFVESCERRRSEGRTLTERQVGVIHDLWDMRCG